MLKTLIKNEFKGIFRDTFMIIMFVYPLIFGLLGRYLVPYLLEQYPDAINASIEYIFVVIAIIPGYIFGALSGFSLLDDKDDNIFLSIKISPLSLKMYVAFKIILAFTLTFISAIFIIIFSDLVSISIGEVISISFLAALQTPISALMINSFANNKVEGFAVMKGLTGILMIFSVISAAFTDWKEYLFYVLPGAWTVKASFAAVLPIVDFNLTYLQYLLIGIVYNVFIIYLTYVLFKKRNNI